MAQVATFAEFFGGSGGGGTTEELLLAIKAKTDLISTTVPIVSSVSADGTIDEIIIGDDYLDANGRAFQWTVEAVEGVAVVDATCTFGAKSGEYSFLVDGTVTDAGSGNWILSFDLLRTDTASCKPGKYEWSVQVNDATDHEITKVRSRTTKTRLVEKQT